MINVDWMRCSGIELLSSVLFRFVAVFVVVVLHSLACHVPTLINS